MDLLPGIFFLIVGPSGVGKGTVIAELKAQLDGNSEYYFPITATTRSPREGEKNGVDYLFLSKEVFEQGIENGDFLEYAIVHGKNYYGLPKKSIIEALEEGKIVVRELDIQGLWNLQKIFQSENLHSIFILPPSMEILEQRIRGRSTLPEEEIKRRMESAEKEIRYSKDCDSRVVSGNNQVRKTVIEIKNIFIREKNIKHHLQ